MVMLNFRFLESIQVESTGKQTDTGVCKIKEVSGMGILT